MTKKILLSVASLFLLWQSYELLRNMSFFENLTAGWLILIAWLINLFITGIFAFAGFAFPTEQLLPDSYYFIQNPKRLKKIHKALGIDGFRQLLLATLWRSKKQREKYFNGKANGIANLIIQSQKSEFGHLLPFLLINIISVYMLATGLVLLSIFTVLINIIGNLYPILLQRHHRMRIQILQKRQNSQLPT